MFCRNHRIYNQLCPGRGYISGIEGRQCKTYFVHFYEFCVIQGNRIIYYDEFDGELNGIIIFGRNNALFPIEKYDFVHIVSFPEYILYALFPKRTISNINIIYILYTLNIPKLNALSINIYQNVPFPLL